MRFKGQTVSNTNVEPVVIPRSPENIVFIAKPVLNLDDFNKVCPEPQPPTITYPENTGKAPDKDYTDEKYTKALNEYYVSRYYWVILMSLKDSPGITWDTVDMSKPETYKNFATELRDAEFLPAEINRITDAVQVVNALDERQLEKAREDFLATQANPQEK